MIVNFIKVNSLWYFDSPEYLAQGGNFEDCLMVQGADVYIESFATGKDNQKVSFDISTKYIKGCFELLVKYHEANDWGYYYDWNYFTIGNNSSKLSIGLCPVTLFLFPNGFPDVIFIKLIDND